MRLNLALGSIAIGQLLLQFLVQLLVLRIAGVGASTDAFLAAQGVPAVLLAIVMVSLQSVWQPKLAVLHENRGAWLGTHGIAHGQAIFVLWVPALALWATSPHWLPLLLPGFSAEQLALAIELSLPLFVTTALNGHVAVLVIALRSRDEFVFPEFTILVSYFLACLMIYFSVPTYGVLAAAWVLVIRAALACVILVIRAGGPLPAPLRALRMKVIWGQMWPLTTGSLIYKTGPLIDRFWSSQAGVGSITTLNLSQSIVGALATVVERAICMPVAPRFARLVVAADFVAVRALYRRTVGRVGAATLGCVLAMLFSRPLWSPVLEIVIGTDSELTLQIWSLCMLLGGYLFVAVAGTTMVTVFYAIGDTKTPVCISVVGFLIGVVLKSAGFLQFGLMGLAVATSVYYLINMLGFVVFLEAAIARAAARVA